MLTDCTPEKARVLWPLHDTVRMIDGLTWKVRVSEYDAVYPYHRRVLSVSLDATESTKRTKRYNQIKGELGDDWAPELD